MNDHLSPTAFSALVDGQLEGDNLRLATEHLKSCAACTSMALEHSLLKNAITRNGEAHKMPAAFETKMRALIAEQKTVPTVVETPAKPSQRSAFAGWAVAAAMLLTAGGLYVVEQKTRTSESAALRTDSLVTEVLDQHIATLASTQQPEVLSSDRHTVKPWFQGKIPFSFNLPDSLPGDIHLDGANLAYLHGHPIAQLLYSIGRHRVSVFVEARNGNAFSLKVPSEHAGYHLLSFTGEDVDAVAISDVDPVRLAELVRLIERAQTPKTL
jgi:anti-sigma factor RsiW